MAILYPPSVMVNRSSLYHGLLGGCSVFSLNYAHYYLLIVEIQVLSASPTHLIDEIRLDITSAVYNSPLSSKS